MTDFATLVDGLPDPSARVVHVRVLLDPSYEQRLTELAQQLQQAELDDEWSNEPAKAPQIMRQIADLNREADEARTRFSFVNIGSYEWERLLAAHPPSDDQRRAGYDHDPETFRPVAAARACVHPEGASPETFEQLRSKIAGDDWQAIWEGCVAANRSGVDIRPSVTRPSFCPWDRKSLSQKSVTSVPAVISARTGESWSATDGTIHAL